jgi:hypothetical protein
MATRHNKLTRLALIATFALLLCSSVNAFAGVGVVVTVAPPPIPIAHEVVVASPGAGYVWVGGHYGWYPHAGYRWVGGSWVRPPFRGARWVAPRYYAGPRGRTFYHGYWRR